MKANLSINALSVSAILFSGMASAAITGTTSAEMTFVTTITTGTCTAKVYNGSTQTSTISFGDIYTSDVGKMTKPLTIKFTACNGVTAASVTAAAGSGGVCTGEAYTTPADTTNTGFEVWKGDAADVTGNLMGCTTPPTTQKVTVSGGTAEFPMTSRIVAASGKTPVPGAISAPVTFTVGYE